VAEPEYSIVDQNLRAAMRFFGRASGCGDISERDGVVLIDSGVNYSVFNIGMFTSPVSAQEMLAERIASAAGHFESRRTRWSMWVCDDLFPQALRVRIPRAFQNARLRRLTEAPGMIADRLAPRTRVLPPIVPRPVTDAVTRSHFAHITSMNFDIPFATCQAVYANERAWSYDYHGFVGYANGTPVATVAIVIAAGVLGVYSVSTLPAHRHKGYAEALMRIVLEDYYRSTGIERTVLQATRAGFDMYLKMGYRPVSHFSVYMS
jgi:GNAT superfamily N-acetyltransferase